MDSEPLSLLAGLEPTHFSCGLMEVLGPVVEPVSAFVSGSGQDTRKRGRVTAEPIRHRGMRDTIRLFQKMTKETLRSGTIARRLD
jgi:hypothetical protein